MLPFIFILSTSLSLNSNVGNTYYWVMPDTIQVEYSGQADLNDNGIPELVSVTAFGQAWDALLSRLEILSSTGDLLFADEWSSSAWCGGYEFY